MFRFRCFGNEVFFLIFYIKFCHHLLEISFRWSLCGENHPKEPSIPSAWEILAIFFEKDFFGSKNTLWAMPRAAFFAQTNRGYYCHTTHQGKFPWKVLWKLSGYFIERNIVYFPPFHLSSFFWRINIFEQISEELKFSLQVLSNISGGNIAQPCHTVRRAVIGKCCYQTFFQTSLAGVLLQIFMGTKKRSRRSGVPKRGGEGSKPVFDIIRLRPPGISCEWLVACWFSPSTLYFSINSNRTWKFSLKNMIFFWKKNTKKQFESPRDHTEFS